jgi:hypothetical protein
MSCSAAVQFDYPTWAARYPELAASVNQPLAQTYWDEAALFVPCDLIMSSSLASSLAVLLNMVTAHIAALYAPLNGQASPTLVGRVSSATTGTVTVQTDFQASASGAWYNQTKYGAQYWEATKALRSAQYVPGPRSQIPVNAEGTSPYYQPYVLPRRLI